MARPSIKNIQPGPFAHVDNALGIIHQTPEQALRDIKDRQERTRVMDQMTAEINVLQTLRGSEAWGVLVRAWTDEARAVRAALADCTDATTLAKGVGALLLLEGYQTWPEDRVRELTESLEQLKSE